MYAGEPVECIITFRNTCSSNDSVQTASPLLSPLPGRESWTESLLPYVRQLSTRKTSTHGVKDHHRRGGTHRSALSYDTPISIRQASDHGVQSKSSQTSQDHKFNSHKRSISIVSLGDEISPLDKSHNHVPSVASKRPGRTHGRALSFQALPRADFMTSKPVSGKR